MRRSLYHRANLAVLWGKGIWIVAFYCSILRDDLCTQLHPSKMFWLDGREMKQSVRNDVGVWYGFCAVCWSVGVTLHHDASNGNRLRACRPRTTRARHPMLENQWRNESSVSESAEMCVTFGFAIIGIAPGFRWRRGLRAPEPPGCNYSCMLDNWSEQSSIVQASGDCARPDHCHYTLPISLSYPQPLPSCRANLT